MPTPSQLNLIENAKNPFLLLKKFKNTGSAQLCTHTLTHDTHTHTHTHTEIAQGEHFHGIHSKARWPGVPAISNNCVDGYFPGESKCLSPQKLLHVSLIVAGILDAFRRLEHLFTDSSLFLSLSLLWRSKVDICRSPPPFFIVALAPPAEIYRISD